MVGKTIVLAALAGLLVASGLGTGVAADKGHDTMEICHSPPGNPENAHTIRVAAHALPAHMAHGDDVSGPCEG